MSADYAKIRRHLGRRCEVMKRLTKQVGPCTLTCDADHFAVLARSIVAQQISTLAARSINARLAATLGGKVTPRAVAKASDDDLRASGLSRAKVLAVRDLAEQCASGAVLLKKLADMDDEAVIQALIPVRGIGRWTAEMFLIFSLGRLDILPVGDYGLRAGVMRHYGLDALPDKKTLVSMTERWQPYRSVGTWYMWRSAGFVPQSGEDAG